MILKWLFDRIVALWGLLFLWPVLLVVAIMVKVKMPGGSVFFVQKRVGKNGKLFNCHKFRTMTVKHNGSTVSVAGDSRITPFGATLRHYKLDELPGLWDVLIGNMSFVGPRPDVRGRVRPVCALLPPGPGASAIIAPWTPNGLKILSAWPKRAALAARPSCVTLRSRRFRAAFRPWRLGRVPIWSIAALTPRA